jgi:exosortase D (VPLPA-CTERM-specific)
VVSAVDTKAEAAADRRVPLGMILFLASLLAAIAAFWNGLASLVDAWDVPEYSHGPLVPLISTFLFLREMRDVPPVDYPVRDRFPGLAVLALGLLIGIAGNLAAIDQIVAYGLMVWLAGMILTNFGLRRGLHFWPAVLHLVFMLPLPQFIYWQVSVGLQMVSSEIGVAIVAAMGIPVFLEGNVIDLGIYKLQVAEACSGLRYLFPMLSFSYVFAVLYQGPGWHKLLLLLAAAPITVLMNSFRIGMIGVLVNAYGIEHAEGFLHTFEGWVIFIACVLILFAMASLLQRLTANPKPLSETLDIEFAGLGEQIARATAIVPASALVLGFALTVATAVGWAVTPQREAILVERMPLVLFPSELGDWTSTTGILLDTNVEATLGADDYLVVDFSNAAHSAPVNLFVAFYENQRAGKAIHSPEVCIPAGGWEVSEWETVSITLADGTVVPVNRAVIQQGLAQQLVYFWFEQRGRRMSGSYAAKFWTLWDSITRNRTDGGLVRLITPIVAGEPRAQAEARIEELMVEIVGGLDRFVPN